MIIRIPVNKIDARKIPLFFLFTIAWIIFALNYFNPDFSVYKNVYDYGASGINTRIEFGYLLFTSIAKFIGLSFVQFRALLSFLGFAIIYSCLNEYTNQTTIIVLAYILYPFLFEAIQIRMFIVSVIILYSIRYLTDLSKTNLIRFLICIALATSFHTSAIFYIILLLAYVNNERNVLFLSIIITAVELVLFNQSFLQRVISTLGFLGENLSLGMRYVSFNDSSKRLMLIYFVLEVISLFVLLICQDKEDNDSLYADNDIYIDIGYRTCLNKCMYITLTMIPLIEIGSSWGRVFRSSLIIIYAAIANYPIREIGTIAKYIKVLYIVGLSFLLFYAHVLTGSNNTYENVFRAMIENNYFFDILFRY